MPRDGSHRGGHGAPESEDHMGGSAREPAMADGAHPDSDAARGSGHDGDTDRHHGGSDRDEAPHHHGSERGAGHRDDRGLEEHASQLRGQGQDDDHDGDHGADDDRDGDGDGDHGEDGGDSSDTGLPASDVPCFGAGTSLATEEGLVPVDWLQPGEQVLTRDHGYQPVLWVGRFEVSRAALAADASLHPVVIAPDAFGPGQPRHELTVSPRHRILLTHPKLELYFATSEVFCAAAHLPEPARTAPKRPDGAVVYYHVLFARHEVILADGLWCESMFAGPEALASLTPANRRAVRAALTGCDGHSQTARYCLKQRDTVLLPDIADQPHTAHANRAAA